MVLAFGLFVLSLEINRRNLQYILLFELLEMRQWAACGNMGEKMAGNTFTDGLRAIFK